MAYENRVPNNRGYGQQGGYNHGYGQNGGGQQRFQSARPRKSNRFRIPEDYVDAAERVMRALFANRSRITTTKMRGFLTLVNDIYNVENLRTEAKLSAESKLKLMRLRVRMVYDAGRERDVKDFVEQAKLLEYLKGVGDSREEMIRFAHLHGSAGSVSPLFGRQG